MKGMIHLKTINKWSLQKSGAASSLLYELFWFVFTYIFVYNPYIRSIPFPSSLALCLISLPVLMYYRKVSDVYATFKRLYDLILIIFFYVILEDILFGRNFYSSHLLYYIVDVLPNSYFILMYYSKNRDRTLRLLMNVAVSASIISVLTFISTPLHGMVIGILKNTEPLAKGAEFTETFQRNYGFVSGFLYSYPIAQSLMFIVINEFDTSKLKSLKLLVLVISIAINARIGLVPIIMYLVFFKLKNATIGNVLSLSLLGYLLNQTATRLLSLGRYRDIIGWISIMFLDGYYALLDVLGINSGAKRYTWFNFVLDNYIVWPREFFGWIFGEHRDVFLDPIKNSDIGYINHLIYGGLVFVALITIFYFVIARSIRRTGLDKRAFLVSEMVLLTYLVCNIKGEFFRPYSFNRVIVFLMTYFIFKHGKQCDLAGDQPETMAVSSGVKTNT